MDDTCKKCRLVPPGMKGCPDCKLIRERIWVEQQVELSIENAKEWGEVMALLMERYALEIREYTERIGSPDETKPEEIIGFMINTATNLFGNLNLNSAPRFAAKIAEARATLKEMERNEKDN